MTTKTLKCDCEGTETEIWDELSPEVLSMIFHHLPVADLLSCSVVSKNWKKAARDVLKRSKECYAYVKRFHEDIQALSKMMASTDLMQMVNGLQIQSKAFKNNQIDPSTQLDFDWSDLENVRLLEETELKLDKLKLKVDAVLGCPWRYLHLDLKCPSQQVLATEDIWLLRALVSATSDSLEKLTIGGDDDWNFIPSFSNDFVNLKVVQALSTQNLTNPCTANFLTNSVPKLQEITGAVIKLQVHLPVDPFILKRLKSILVCADKQVPQGKAMEAFQVVSGLHRLDLQHCHYDLCDPEHSDHDVEAWNSFVFPFVIRSSNTLVELRMYTLELYKLFKTTDGELRFPNLRRLSLASHWHVSLENEICAFKCMNIPKMCPNLQQLELSDAEASYTEVEEVVSRPVGESELQKSNLPLQVEVHCLDRDDGMYRHEYLNFFKEIYPIINKVTIVNWGKDDCSEICKIFWDLQSLEYLELNVWARSKEMNFHIDALLRGINIEESKLARNSCVVAIRPSLFNAKGLKELKITQYAPRRTFSRSWVTEITENIPSRYTRNLKVVFEGSVGLYKGLNRLGALPSSCPAPAMQARCVIEIA